MQFNNQTVNLMRNIESNFELSYDTSVSRLHQMENGWNTMFDIS